MSTSVAAATAATENPVARCLLLIWQNPKTRRFVKVGQLAVSTGDQFEFRYLPAASSEAGFVPLAQFPRLEQTYRSPVLPAFFANRVMSRQRESYDEYASRLGLAAATATPIEILERNGGSRATDTFHIVDDLRYTVDGRVVSRFLASGVSHLPGATKRIAGLRADQELLLRDERDNPANPNAMLIDARAGEPVGYIPDWLVDDVCALRAAAEVRIFAERVNPGARPHLQLLCRLEAQGEPVTNR